MDVWGQYEELGGGGFAGQLTSPCSSSLLRPWGSAGSQRGENRKWWAEERKQESTSQSSRLCKGGSFRLGGSWAEFYPVSNPRTWWVGAAVRGWRVGGGREWGVGVKVTGGWGEGGRRGGVGGCRGRKGGGEGGVGGREGGVRKGQRVGGGEHWLQHHSHSAIHSARRCQPHWEQFQVLPKDTTADWDWAGL